ncbi:MAG: hypothetical protein E6917_00570 [Clostridium botulinum]|nr:hypothetical protein [Clostridium botulinum]
MIIVVGGIVGSNQSIPKKVGETSTKVEDKKEEAPKTKTFKVGDVVELKDFKVTVNKA